MNLTKELSENTCEEVQVTGNIVGHGGRGLTMVSMRILVEETAYTKEVLYLKLNHEWIHLQTYTKQADGEERSKDIINEDIKLYNSKK